MKKMEKTNLHLEIHQKLKIKKLIKNLKKTYISQTNHFWSKISDNNKLKLPKKEKSKILKFKIKMQIFKNSIIK